MIETKYTLKYDNIPIYRFHLGVFDTMEEALYEKKSMEDKHMDIKLSIVERKIDYISITLDDIDFDESEKGLWKLKQST